MGTYGNNASVRDTSEPLSNHKTQNGNFHPKRTPNGNLEFDRGAKSETEGTKWKLRPVRGTKWKLTLLINPITHTHVRYTNLTKSEGNRAFLFFRTQPAAGSYPQFCLLPPVHAAASLRMLAASAGFPLQNIDAQRQQGRQPWGQPTEGLCTPRRAGSVCRAHPPPPAGLCAGRRAGKPSRFMCVHQGSCRVSGVCWHHLPP